MILVNNIVFEYNNHTNSFKLRCPYFEALPSEMTCIVGSNGSGKTTFLKLLNGILKPKEGFIKIDGKNLSEISKNDLLNNTGWIDAAAVQSLVDELFVADHIAFVLKNSRAKIPFFHRFINLNNVPVKSFLGEELANQIDQIFNMRIANLSSGQKQTVTIALTVLSAMNKRNIILADEGTANLDIINAENFFSTIKQIIINKNITCTIVTHDLYLTAKFSDKTYGLKSGSLEKIHFNPNDNLQIKIEKLRNFFHAKY